MSDHDDSDSGELRMGPDGKFHGRCPFVVSPRQLGFFHAEVDAGPLDGKPVMVIKFFGLAPDGGDMVLGVSEVAAVALTHALRDFRAYARKLKEIPPDPVDPPGTEKGA